MRLQVQEVETQRQEENSEMGDGSGFSKSEIHWCSYLDPDLVTGPATKAVL